MYYEINYFTGILCLASQLKSLGRASEYEARKLQIKGSVTDHLFVSFFEVKSQNESIAIKNIHTRFY